MTVDEYKSLYFGALDTLKSIVSSASTGSAIETRYITSEGNDEEQWLGYLRNDDGAVDIWLITLSEVRGIGLENKAIGTTDKQVTVVLDYFYDYRQGLDYDQNNNTTNTERQFLSNLLAVDFALEQSQGCLGNSIYIVNWDFRIRLKRFTSDTTHWGQGILNLMFSEVIL